MVVHHLLFLGTVCLSLFTGWHMQIMLSPKFTCSEMQDKKRWIQVTPLMARDLTKPSKASIAKKGWTQKGEPEGTRPLPATQKPLASHSHPMDSRGWAGPKPSRTQTEEPRDGPFSFFPNSCSECAVVNLGQHTPCPPCIPSPGHPGSS